MSTFELILAAIAFLVILLLLLLGLHERGYVQGRKAGYNEGYKFGYEFGRKTADNWWIASEGEVEKTRRAIWEEDAA